MVTQKKRFWGFRSRFSSGFVSPSASHGASEIFRSTVSPKSAHGFEFEGSESIGWSFRWSFLLLPWTTVHGNHVVRYHSRRTERSEVRKLLGERGSGRTSREKSRFVARMSHELRTPLQCDSRIHHLLLDKRELSSGNRFSSSTHSRERQDQRQVITQAANPRPIQGQPDGWMYRFKHSP